MGSTRSFTSAPAWCVSLALLLTVAAPLSAQASGSIYDDDMTVTPVGPARGLFVDDEWRSPRFGAIPGIFARAGLDVVSIPTGVIGWSGTDWALFGAVVGQAVVLSVPFGGESLDVRIQSTIDEALGGPNRPRVWVAHNEPLIWGAIIGIPTSLMIYGAANGADRHLEAGALMFEAFLVGQVFSTTLKFLTGREGPNEGSGLGKYRGPAGFFESFPSGTPSGHATSMWALYAVLTTAFPDPALSLALGVGLGALTTMIVADDYHYVSEVIVGAAMGYAIGRWVVHRRSARFSSAPVASLIPDAITPTLTGDTRGLSLAWRF